MKRDKRGLICSEVGWILWGFLLTTILFLLLMTPFIHEQSADKPCYVSLNSSGEFNQVLLSNISTSLISQYITEVQPIPSSGISGSNHCIYEVSVTKDGEKVFVTLQGKDLNSFGESDIKGTDGFKESILRSLYRSQRDKRGLICSDYPIKW